MNFEELLLHELFDNEPFARKVMPFIQEDYFEERADGEVFKLIRSFVDQYNAMPTKEALMLSVVNIKAPQDIFDQTKSLIGNIEKSPGGNKPVNMEWLFNQTEKWCQERALFNGIVKSIGIMDGSDTSLGKGAIPEILSDALAVCFDTHVGHDFLPSVEDRYKFYHTREKKFPFDITLLNTITDGGVTPKTLNIILAGCVHPDTQVRIRIRKKIQSD